MFFKKRSSSPPEPPQSGLLTDDDLADAIRVDHKSYAIIPSSCTMAIGSCASFWRSPYPTDHGGMTLRGRWPNTVRKKTRGMVVLSMPKRGLMASDAIGFTHTLTSITVNTTQ